MKLPSLPFRLRTSGGSAAVVDADEADGKAGLAAVLGGRLKALGQMALARAQHGPPEVPLAFPLAVAGLLFAVVGTLLWLILAADHTVAQRRARVPVAEVPVLLPDGSPRGGGDRAAASASVDPVDVPVELGPSRLDANLESGRFGPLPRIAPDGKAPWQVYARPFPQADTRPRIALVLTDIGLSAPTTDSAVNRLPGAVTFAVPAGTAGLQAIVDKVRGTGHEVLLTVPLEPNGYPRNDPGPNTLLTTLPDERNAERLERALASATGYVGVTSTSGTLFTTKRANLQPVLQTLQRRGLVFVDSWLAPGSVATRLSTEIGLPRAVSDSLVDRVASAGGIDAQLAELERLAKINGVAVGFAQAPYPVTIERIANWAATLQSRGIVLAPITAVVNRQADR